MADEALLLDNTYTKLNKLEASSIQTYCAWLDQWEQGVVLTEVQLESWDFLLTIHLLAYAVSVYVSCERNKKWSMFKKYTIIVTLNFILNLWNNLRGHQTIPFTNADKDLWHSDAYVAV